MFPKSMRSAMGAVLVALLAGVLVGFLTARAFPTGTPEEDGASAVQGEDVPEGWEPPDDQEMGRAAAVTVEVGDLLADSPGALLPAAVHRLEAIDRLNLDSIATFPQEAMGALLELPFGLQPTSRSHTAVQFDFPNEDGMVLRATLIRWARCRPRYDQLFHLQPRIARLNRDIADPENQRLLSYLLALRMVGLDEGRGRRPHYLYDEVHVGNGVGRLRSTFGPCAQCDSGSRRYEFHWTETVEGGYKDLTLLLTSNYPGVNPELLVQMARTIRMDDTTILQCDRPTWPTEPAEIIRRIDAENLMDPGPDEAAMEWDFGTESTDPSEGDAGVAPAAADSPSPDAGPRDS